ncbi:hypothetical protein ACWDAZ_32820, partial [Streptomyces sp. NPDC001215]
MDRADGTDRTVFHVAVRRRARSSPHLQPISERVRDPQVGGANTYAFTYDGGTSYLPVTASAKVQVS